MKKTKRITKLTVETERTFIFRMAGGQRAGWCEQCDAEAEMASVTEAARQAGLSEMAIYHLIESGALHFREDANGYLFICLNSLSK